MELIDAGYQDTPAGRHQRSKVSLHEGHDPIDPRVAMVEDMACDLCCECSNGALRWQDRYSKSFFHPDDLGYEATTCEASNLLRTALTHGSPIYTGAELEFEELGEPLTEPKT